MDLHFLCFLHFRIRILFTRVTLLWNSMKSRMAFKMCNKDMQSRCAIKICNNDMERRYSINRQLAPWPKTWQSQGASINTGAARARHKSRSAKARNDRGTKTTSLNPPYRRGTLWKGDFRSAPAQPLWGTKNHQPDRRTAMMTCYDDMLRYTTCTREGGGVRSGEVKVAGRKQEPPT